MESAAPFTRDFHPLDNAHAEHTTDKEGASWTYDTPSLDNEYQEGYYIKML